MRDDPKPTDGHDEDEGAEREEADEGASRDPGSPFEPHEDDDSPLGDTDQHSDA
jgi:hypothetical protein